MLQCHGNLPYKGMLSWQNSLRTSSINLIQRIKMLLILGWKSTLAPNPQLKTWLYLEHT